MIIINGDDEYGLLPACIVLAIRRAYGSSQLAWSKGRRPLGAVHEPSERLQLLCHDVSTINIVLIIITITIAIIIIIIIMIQVETGICRSTSTTVAVTVCYRCHRLRRPADFST